MRPATVDKGRGRLPITTTIWALRRFETWSQLPKGCSPASNVPGLEVELAHRRHQPRYNRRTHRHNDSQQNEKTQRASSPPRDTGMRTLDRLALLSLSGYILLTSL